MKTILLKLLFIALPLAAVTVSCENDDINAADLTGTWDMVGLEEGAGAPGGERTATFSKGERAVRFNKNGSYEYFNEGEWHIEGATWSIAGSYVVMAYSDGSHENIRIEKLTTNALILSSSRNETIEGFTYDYTYRETYEKR